MNCDRLADLSFFTVQVAQNHVHFESVRIEACCARKLVDGQIDLVGNQEVEAQDVVRRFTESAPIDPAAAPELVSFPGLSGREPGNDIAAVDAIALSAQVLARESVGNALRKSRRGYSRLSSCSRLPGRWNHA